MNRAMALCYHVLPRSFQITHNRQSTTVVAQPLKFRPKLCPLMHDQKTSMQHSVGPSPRVTRVVCLVHRDQVKVGEKKTIVLADVYLVGESVAFVFTPMRRRDPSSCGRDPCLSDGSGASSNVGGGLSKLNSPPRPSDGLCSFPSALSCSFNKEHTLPYDVLNLTASKE